MHCVRVEIYKFRLMFDVVSIYQNNSSRFTPGTMNSYVAQTSLQLRILQSQFSIS